MMEEIAEINRKLLEYQQADDKKKVEMLRSRLNELVGDLIDKNKKLK